MQLGFAKDLVADFSGNKNDSQTITIGVDTPNGTGSGSIVDVVDPVWNTQNFTIDKTNKKITVDLIGTDKYYLSDSLTTDKIKVFVDGKEASSITKQLSASSSVTNGVKYTLTLSGWEETSEQTGNVSQIENWIENITEMYRAMKLVLYMQSVILRYMKYIV